MNRLEFKLLLTVFMVYDHVYMFLPAPIGSYAHILTRFVSAGFAYLYIFYPAHLWLIATLEFIAA